MKRALIVCMDNFPDEGACSSILKKMIDRGGLSDNIGKIDILSLSYSFSQNAQTYKGCDVYKAVIWPLIEKNRMSLLFEENACRTLYGYFIKILNKMIMNFSRKTVFFPFGINRAIYCEITKLDKNNIYDVVIPVTGNFTVAHAVWQYCNKNKKPYIVYQVDPISTNFTVTKIQYPTIKRFEEYYFADAKAIITTKIIKEEYDGTEEYNKMFDLEFPNVSIQQYKYPTETIENKKIKCVYTGKLNYLFRNPTYTLNLFNSLDYSNIIFQLVGVNSDEIKNDLTTDTIECLGNRSYTETRNIIETADFLINIGNLMMNQVPSKLFEYISTGIPIINVCKNRQCPSIGYLEKYGNALSIFEDETIEINKEKVILFLRENRGCRVDKKRIEEEFFDCTPEYCGRRFSEIINMNL